MDHHRKTEYTDKQIYKPEYAGTTKRNRNELASVIWGGGGGGGGGGGLWLWENGGQVGSKVYGGGGGGGGFHASCWGGGGFSLRRFGAESRSFGRWWREVVQLE